MDALAEAGTIVTIEDHNVNSGLGMSVAAWVAERGLPVRVVMLGVRGYASSGTPADLFAAAGLDDVGIAASVKAAISA